MTIRREDQEADGGGQRTAVADRPIAREDERQPAAEGRSTARNDIVEEERVMHSPAGGWDLARGWVRSLSAVIMVTFAVVGTFLAGRMAFLLADANPNNGFVDFIHDVGGFFAQPFQGIIADNGRLEYAAPIAMVVYAVAALLLIAVLYAITAGPSAAGEKVVTSRTRQSERAVR